MIMMICIHEHNTHVNYSIILPDTKPVSNISARVWKAHTNKSNCEEFRCQYLCVI